MSEMSEITDDTFVFTRSGKKASINNPPTPEDFAVSVARLPRFTGNTSTWWTGLSHQVVTAFIVRLFNTLAIHGAAIHDSVEILTGDKPTPFKTEEEIKFEKRALARIYATNNALISDEILKDVKRADRIALVAEAYELMPLNTHDWFSQFATKEDVKYISIARNFVKRLARFQSTHFGAYEPQGGAVLLYTHFILKLRAGADPEKEFQEMLKGFYSIGLKYDVQDIRKGSYE